MFHQIAEIYNTVETHESLTECQEATLVLENYLRDFNALAEWFRLKWDYENTPAPQRPTSLAWDVSKTNLTKNKSRSGKSTPSVGSGRSSPNVSGKVSPKILSIKSRSTSSAPTSPLPSIEQPILEGKPLETNVVDSKTVNDKNQSPKSNKSENNLTSSGDQKKMILKARSKSASKIVESKQSTDNVKDSLIKPEETERLGASGNHSNVATIGENTNEAKKEQSKCINSNSITSSDAQNISMQTENVNVTLEINQDVKSLPESKRQQNTNSEIAGTPNQSKQQLDVKLVDSPSEDQRTYDIFRKTGVQSAEKSTSTEDDFPRLPPVKKTISVKVNQESQTEEVEKKATLPNKPKIEPSRINRTVTTAKPAYSTALTRTASAKTVGTVKQKIELPKPVASTRIAPKFSKPILGTRSLPTSSNSRSGLARSKTVGDMKSTNNPSAFKPIATAPRTESRYGQSRINKNVSSASTNTKVDKRPAQIKEKVSKLASDDCTSSVETLVNHGNSLDNVNVTNSSNSISSSSETINNDSVKNESLHSDGWLTVKNRSRFKSGYNKPRKSDSVLSWSTRFHQVSATASLPALALLPEVTDGKSVTKTIDNTVKENPNALKSMENNEKKPQTKSEDVKTKPSFSHRMALRRSHTILSRLSVNRKDPKTDFEEKTNVIKKATDKNVFSEPVKKHSDSETDDESKAVTQDDLASEEEEHKKAMQLCEEEERLEQEIAQLKGMEIEVDTETDGTETDGEIQGDSEDQQEMQENSEDDEISLEARYEPVLAGKIFLNIFFI